MTFSFTSSNALCAGVLPTLPLARTLLSSSPSSPSSSLPSPLSSPCMTSSSSPPGCSMIHPILWHFFVGLGSLKESHLKPPSPSPRCSLQKSSTFSRLTFGARVLMSRAGCCAESSFKSPPRAGTRSRIPSTSPTPVASPSSFSITPPAPSLSFL